MLKSLGASSPLVSTSTSVLSQYAKKAGLGTYLGIEEEEEEEVEEVGRGTTVKPSSRDGEFDLLIVGGGATGAGIAVDAASRGLRVGLVERNDFSSGEYFSFWLSSSTRDGKRKTTHRHVGK